jgi:hypothetical protein
VVVNHQLQFSLLKEKNPIGNPGSPSDIRYRMNMKTYNKPKIEANKILGQLKEEEEIFKDGEKKDIEQKKKVLTHYFDKDTIAYPDTENFFGNGILLHKLRTSAHGRYFNALSLLKMLSFEPVLVGLQMLPGCQIFVLASIQAVYVAWLGYCGFKEKIFSSRTIFVSNLVCDTSILVFLLLGLVFHVSGGVKTWPTAISSPFQFFGVALLVLSCLFGVVDLVVSTWIIIKTTLAKRKVQKYLEELKKRKEQQEDSMVKLRDDSKQQADESRDLALDDSASLGQDKRALNPFWRLKFRKGKGQPPSSPNLKRSVL